MFGAGVEQPVDELGRQRVLADQRMRQQSLPSARTVAGHRRLGGQSLVRGHVLHQPEQLRRHRLLRQRRRAACPDRREHFDDVIVALRKVLAYYLR